MKAKERDKRDEANFYSKLILNTESGGFSTFAGVFDPGNGKIGLAFFKVRLVGLGPGPLCTASTTAVLAEGAASVLVLCF